MNIEDINKFQTSQKEIVSMLGAFLVPLKTFSGSLSNIDDLSCVRNVQIIVNDFTSKMELINQFCNEYHYLTYSQEVKRSVARMASLLGYQTLSSKKIEPTKFKVQIDSYIEGIGEVMIAMAQIAVPSVDANIKSGNSFAAYCFLSGILDSVTSMVVIIDPYVDQSIFYRYLYRLSTSVNIKVITDSAKLSGERLRSYESVETLFLSEYPNYERKLLSNLHDRYLITETGAYSLGGSMKDAARKSDYSITQVSEEKKLEILQIYA